MNSDFTILLKNYEEIVCLSLEMEALFYLLN